MERSFHIAKLELADVTKTREPVLKRRRGT
jgi:hypothetical protein